MMAKYRIDTDKQRLGATLADRSESGGRSLVRYWRSGNAVLVQAIHHSADAQLNWNDFDISGVEEKAPPRRGV